MQIFCLFTQFSKLNLCIYAGTQAAQDCDALADVLWLRYAAAVAADGWVAYILNIVRYVFCVHMLSIYIDGYPLCITECG